ncbi:hypothetical protein LUZ60_013067 [Juncus effusus]|nr:hypothetical protein LUZ60_013067 [Juncus effusus]
MEKKSWIRGNLIGNGSFGSVSIAVERSTRGIFAVKSVNSNCSSPVSIVSLEKEIEILKEVDSPFVVGYLGDDTSVELNCGKFRNLHMEFVPGGTVAELAVKRGGLEEKEIRGYARCLTRALHYLHTELRVIHCDVKGRNLLAGSSPAGGKLADFGSAIRIDNMAKEGNLIGGTPFWMAPEVSRGEKPKTASDVWSLACTIIEMANGSHPWKEFEPINSSDIAGFLLRIGFGEISPNYPTKLSNDGKDFLDKCLRIDPKERWSCEKLLRHPFIADVADDDSMEPSPRCVLDWNNQESEDESEEFCDNFDFCHGKLFEEEEEEKTLEFARARVSEIASSSCEEKLEFEWDSDEWETVRWDPQCQKRTIPQFSDFTRADAEMSQTSGSSQILLSVITCEELCNGSDEDIGVTRYMEGDRDGGRGEGETSWGCCNCNCGECFYYDCCCSSSFSFSFSLEGGFEEGQSLLVWTVRACHWRAATLIQTLFKPPFLL